MRNDFHKNHCFLQSVYLYTKAHINLLGLRKHQAKPYAVTDEDIHERGSFKVKKEPSTNPLLILKEFKQIN